MSADAASRLVGGDSGALHEVELVGEPVRVRSNFVSGYTQLPVRLRAR